MEFPLTYLMRLPTSNIPHKILFLFIKIYLTKDIRARVLGFRLNLKFLIYISASYLIYTFLNFFFEFFLFII